MIRKNEVKPLLTIKKYTLMLIPIFDYLIKYETLKKENEKISHLFIMDQQLDSIQRKNKSDKIRKLILFKENEKVEMMDKYVLNIDNESQELIA